MPTLVGARRRDRVAVGGPGRTGLPATTDWTSDRSGHMASPGGLLVDHVRVEGENQFCEETRSSEAR